MGKFSFVQLLLQSHLKTPSYSVGQICSRIFFQQWENYLWFFFFFGVISSPLPVLSHNHLHPLGLCSNDILYSLSSILSFLVFFDDYIVPGLFLELVSSIYLMRFSRTLLHLTFYINLSKKDF